MTPEKELKKFFSLHQSAIDKDQNMGKQKWARAGDFWTPQEDHRLQAAFHQGMSVADMSQHHERSVYAIQCRLIKHGLLNHALQPIKEKIIIVVPAIPTRNWRLLLC